LNSIARRLRGPVRRRRPVAESVGQRLRRLREERGLSQRELSEPGISYAYISRIEAGARRPSLTALRKLATKLGVTALELERGSDNGVCPHCGRPKIDRLAFVVQTKASRWPCLASSARERRGLRDPSAGEDPVALDPVDEESEPLLLSKVRPP
jgi:transcriptional regulator with XRE-family HTH domain